MVVNNIKTYVQYILMNNKASLSLRSSFLLQSFFMLMSNIIFFSFWWIYFSNFSSIKGWTLSDIACLYGIVSGAYGIFCLFFGGAKFLARMIYEGDLDAIILRPQGLIFQILSAKSVPSGWGDILSSCVFFTISGYISFKTIAILPLLIASATIIITSFGIIVDSLAFWIGNSHALSKQIFEFLLTFSNYPKTIYVGSLKYFLLTVIPSGFIGFFPVEALRDLSLWKVGSILCFACGYAFLAKYLFYKGLKNYTSGNKTGFRV